MPAPEFLVARGLLQRPPRVPKALAPPSAHQAVVDILAKLPPLPLLPVEPEVTLTNWIQQGYLVGRGRRSIDAMVLRFPQEQLIRNGYMLADKRERLGTSSYETRKTGFGVELLPAADAEALRRDARRVSHLLAKATLNLPCFGLWMPETYWPAFIAAREEMVRAHSLAPAHIRAVAATHADDLRGGGLERETDLIIDRLGQLNLLVEAKRADLRTYLLRRFNEQLALRTPDVLAACVEFRTARQRWAPYESTEAPYRQLAVDVMQATFSATYRTGDWPSRFKSIAGRRLADHIERRFESMGQSADGETATSLLDLAMSWEGDATLEAVVKQFRLLTEGLRFEESDVEGLGGAEDDDNQGDDSDEL